MTLTDRQEEVLGFIRDSMRQRGLSPTCAEIQSRFGFSSPATVSSHLTLLEKKGVIRRETRCGRNIRLTEPVRQARMMDIPVLGLIPAGLPMDQEQEFDRAISIDADVFQIPKNARTFAVEVKGDSMIGAGILEGDYVVLEQCPSKNGDIVAAAIDGEVTLKRLVIQQGKPFLHAENPSYKDITPAHDLLIQGVFRALLRLHAKAA
ncbi:MAG: transcriptional repressor LexA [Chthoniobacterales bacterium]